MIDQLKLGRGGFGLGSLTLPPGKGVPATIIENGVKYYRIRFGGAFLDRQIQSQPLYGSDNT